MYNAMQIHKLFIRYWAHSLVLATVPSSSMEEKASGCVQCTILKLHNGIPNTTNNRIEPMRVHVPLPRVTGYGPYDRRVANSFHHKHEQINLAITPLQAVPSWIRSTAYESISKYTSRSESLDGLAPCSWLHAHALLRLVTL